MTLLAAVVATGLAMVLAGLLEQAGLVPLWVYQGVLVAMFPVFALTLGLWWMAPEGEEDIPFLGY